MDLDKLKESWKSQEIESTPISKEDIYKMAHSKSSSIVKWIFIIGILELLFWGGLNIFFAGSSYSDLYESLHLQKLVNATIYIHYFVIVLFLVGFYKNYKSISISENTKGLIKKILNTRRVVKYYVYFNLVYAILTNIIVVLLIFSDLDTLIDYYNTHGITVNQSKDQLLISLIISMVVVLTLLFFTMWLFYKLLYGSLLKKLNKNYEELIKINDEE